MMFLALLTVSVVVVQLDASNILQSIPFDPFRLECPKKHGVTEVSLKMVESAGFQRQDVLFTLSCDPIDQMFPPAQPELDDLEREDCYWSGLFDPIIDSNINFTCSESEYLAGVSRIAFTSVQLLCCRLRTRQQFKCAQNRYSKPVGPDPQQQFKTPGSLVSSLAIKNDFYLVKYCQLTQKSIEQIEEDIPTTSTIPTTSSSTSRLTTLRSTVSTTTSPITPSRRTRSTTLAAPTTAPVLTTPVPTRLPKRVIIVTRPPPQFRFAPGAELPTEFPQQPRNNFRGVAPPSAGPPATFDRGFPELIPGEERRRLIETAPPGQELPREEEDRNDGATAFDSTEVTDEQSSFGEEGNEFEQSADGAREQEIGENAGQDSGSRPIQQGIKTADGQQFIIDAQGQRHFSQQTPEKQNAFLVPSHQLPQTAQSATPPNIGDQTRYPFGRSRPLLPIVEPLPRHFIEDTQSQQQFGVTQANVASGDEYEDEERELEQAYQESESESVDPFFESSSVRPTQSAQQRPVNNANTGGDLSTEFSPFEEEEYKASTYQIWPSYVRSGGVSTVTPTATTDAPQRAEEQKGVERKVEKPTPFATAGVSATTRTASSLPPGWIPFDGIPGISPEVMHKIKFPEFEEDRHVQPDVNYVEMSHLTDYPELELVDNGEQSLAPLIPIIPQPLPAQVTKQQQTLPPQPQIPLQQQTQAQQQLQQQQSLPPLAHGLRIQEGFDRVTVAQPSENRLHQAILNSVQATTARSAQQAARSSGNEKIVIFENQYKERTKRPWPANRPLPSAQGGVQTQVRPAPQPQFGPLQPVQPVQAPLGNQIHPAVASPGAARPSAGPPATRLPVTQAPPLPQQTITARQIVEPEEPRSSGAEENHEVLTFCTKEIAVKDSNRMIIACGIDEVVWQPSHCPVGSECFQVTDSTYRICCFSGGQ